VHEYVSQFTSTRKVEILRLQTQKIHRSK